MNLFEVSDLHESGSPSRVDRERGVIRRVKLLGWKSANGRDYDPKGVDPSMYEGRVVNIDHAKDGKSASARDRFGRVVDIIKDGSGLYGDLEYLKSHPMAESVAEAAERMPGVFGMSHTASGKVKRGPRGVVVENVTKVISVDLVGDPATVSGLYEGKGMRLNEMAEAGIMPPMDAPPPEPAGEEAPVDHEQALLDAAKAVLDDATMDTAAKLKKIKEILKVIDSGKGGGEAPDFGGSDDESAEDEGGEGDSEKKKEESRKPGKLNLREELERFKARDLLRGKADEAGIRLPKALLESVRSNLTDKEATALIGELKAGSTGRNAPRSAAPSKAGVTGLKESKDIPADPKALGRWLSGK